MITMLLSLAYRVADADRYCRGSGHFQEMALDLMGQGVTGKTVSIGGLGRVGTQAAKRLRHFDVKLLYTKGHRLSPAEEAHLGIKWVADKDELISRADYLCLLVNFEEANLKIMGRRQFGLMKPTSYFVNVGRSRLVDEETMIEALQIGAIAGAGLDVFWNEPPLVSDARIPEALRKMDNVILTPHNGATWDSRGAQTLAIAEAIVNDILTRAEVPVVQSAGT